MRSIVLAILAAGCIAAACSAPTVLKRPTLVPGWPDTGTPPATVAAREARFYRDDKRVVWDDTGKRHEPEAQ
jgi:hypothetical protein